MKAALSVHFRHLFFNPVGILFSSEEIQANFFVIDNDQFGMDPLSAQLSSEVIGIVVEHFRLLYQTLSVCHALAHQTHKQRCFAGVRFQCQRDLDRSLTDHATVTFGEEPVPATPARKRFYSHHAHNE